MRERCEGRNINDRKMSEGCEGRKEEKRNKWNESVCEGRNRKRGK